MKLGSALLIAFGIVAIVVVAATPDPVRLVRRLADRSAARRDAAARELLDLGREAIPALEAAASSADPEVRTRAGAILELVRDDGAPRIRARAAEIAVRDALAASDGLDAGSESDARIAALVPESARFLADAARRVGERDFVPRSLTCALTRHAAPESFEVLGELVRDERVFPSAALCAAREVDRAFAEDRDRATDVRAMAASALPALDDAMRSPHAPTRRMALALYGALSGDDAAPRLAEMAIDVDAGVRAEAARVMGVHHPAESAAPLRRLAADSDEDVRVAALTALARVPGVPHPEPAVAVAADPSPAVRAAAARLLGRDATPETLAVLDDLANDRSARVRAAARRALAGLQ